MANNVSGLVNDPDFAKLSPSDQRSALAAVSGDQGFSTLSDADTTKFVSGMQQPAIPNATAQAQAKIKQLGQQMKPSPLGGAYGSPAQEAAITAGLPNVKPIAQLGTAIGTMGLGSIPLTAPTQAVKAVGTGILGPGGSELMRNVASQGPSMAGQAFNAVKAALPSSASVDQVAKVSRILYQLGVGAGGATFLYRELFGGKR